MELAKWEVFVDDERNNKKLDLMIIDAASREEAIESYIDKNTFYAKKLGKEYVRMGMGMYIQAVKAV